MKNLKLIAGFLAIGIIMTGCSRHPKVDFSVPTEETESADTTAATEAVTTLVPPEPEEPGFAKADDAYQAYLDASEAQDVDAFCALFNADEIVNAKELPSKFLKKPLQAAAGQRLYKFCGAYQSGCLPQNGNGKFQQLHQRNGSLRHGRGAVEDHSR